MKMLLSLFSFYMMALSCVLCSDKPDCNYLHPEQSIESAASHSGHKGDEENCSPFCICSCCGQTISNEQYLASTGLIFSTTTATFVIDRSSFVSEVYLPIWQPPKIS